MTRNYFSILSDWIFSAVTFFLISFILIGYFVPKPFSFIFAALSSALIMLPVIKITLKRKEKTLLRKKDEREAKTVFSALELMEENELIEYFEKVFAKSGLAVEKCKHSLLLTEKGDRCFFKTALSPATKTDAVRFFNKLNEKERAVIFCDGAEKIAEDFISRFNGKIRIPSRKDIFCLIKTSEILPPTKFDVLGEQKTRVRLKPVLYKKKAKTFFAFGLAFLAFSFFVPYKLYYVICGGLSLCFSLALRFFGIPDKEEKPF